MRLVPDWRQAWKWFSVQAFAILAAVPLVWVNIPPEVQAYLPPEWRPYILALFALAGFIGRVTDQGKQAAK